MNEIAKQISDLDEEIDQRISDNLTTTDLQTKKDELTFAMNNISPADVLSFSQCADLIAIITPEEFEEMAWSSGVDNVQQIHIGSRTTFTVGNGEASETRTGCGINKLL